MGKYQGVYYEFYDKDLNLLHKCQYVCVAGLMSFFRGNGYSKSQEKLDIGKKCRYIKLYHSLNTNAIYNAPKKIFNLGNMEAWDEKHRGRIYRMLCNSYYGVFFKKDSPHRVYYSKPGKDWLWFDVEKTNYTMIIGIYSLYRLFNEHRQQAVNAYQWKLWSKKTGIKVSNGQCIQLGYSFSVTNKELNSITGKNQAVLNHSFCSGILSKNWDLTIQKLISNWINSPKKQMLGDFHITPSSIYKSMDKGYISPDWDMTLSRIKKKVLNCA